MTPWGAQEHRPASSHHGVACLIPGGRQQRDHNSARNTGGREVLAEQKSFCTDARKVVLRLSGLDKQSPDLT